MTDTIEQMIALSLAGETFPFGAIPSQIDRRDYTFAPEALAPTNSVVLHPGAGKTPVYNQQGGTCTGYSIAAALSLMHFAETGKRVSYDGSELHHRIVKSYSAGAMPRDVLEDVRTRGAETQETGGTSLLTTIAGYGWVDSHNRDAVMAAVSGGPLIIAVWLNQDFYDTWNPKSRAYVPAGRDGFSFHAMTVVGGDLAQGITVQNQWGETNGGFALGTARGGFINLSWAYLVKHCAELWSVADASNTTLDGYIKTHEITSNSASGVSLVKRADKPAVYMLVGKGRWWVPSQDALYAMGLGGQPTMVLQPNDEVWSYPVIGNDAAVDQRA